MLKSCVDQAKLEAKEMLFAEPKLKEKKTEGKKNVLCLLLHGYKQKLKLFDHFFANFQISK